MDKKNETQQPDTQPGNYYVTAIDGQRYVKLLGPFTNDHQAALDMVDAVRIKATELFPEQATWAYFGTCRVSDDFLPTRAGKLNEYFNFP